MIRVRMKGWITVKRLRILALSLALLLNCLSPAVMPGAGAAKSYTACPYWIGVDIVNQRLTVYRTADNGVAHSWLCTTGRAGFETPTGVFYMPEKKGDERKDWCTLDGFKVRFATRVADGFYIHSVQYSDKKSDAVRLASLARLGHSGSLGSVIVEYTHAKWISQNCPKGTMVVVHAGVNDQLISNRLKGVAGTDITASLPEPPTVESIQMNPSSEFSIAIGETRQLKCTFKPSGAQSALEWESSDAKRATVDGNGLVRGVSEGSSTIKARTVNGKEAKVKVSVYDPTKPTGVELSASVKNGWDEDRAILYLNDGIQLKAKLSPSTAVTGLEWKSTNTKRGTVNSSGWIKAVGEGNFEIEVKTTKEGKKDK